MLRTGLLRISPLRGWSTNFLGFRTFQSHTSQRQLLTQAGIEDLFANPSWSVKSLLEISNGSSPQQQITPEQLRHLLRLSALPSPKNAEEEAEMISTLECQLHFVQAIQGIDTTGIEPLQSIRDETMQARKEVEVTMNTLKGEFEKEEIVGFAKRVRRKKLPEPTKPEEENWDPLALAPQKLGRYIMVKTGTK